MKYHDVFLPLDDVYRLGGEFWQHLGNPDDGCNLVVLPKNLVDRLQEGKSQRDSGGISDALAGMKKFKYAERIPTEVQDATIWGLNANLHIASVRGTFNQEQVPDLVNKIKKEFQSDEKDPAILTTIESYHLHLSDLGMRVEDPKALLCKADIVEEGILQGSQDLYSALWQSNMAHPITDIIIPALPLSEAKSAMGRDLYMHQFVRFGDNNFAKVTGEYEWNRDRTRIIGVNGSRLQIIDPSERSMSDLNGSGADSLFGIKPLDMEQYLTIRHGLMNPDVQIVFITGRAGSGKTILSYAAAVEQLISHKKSKARYEKGMLLKATDLLGGSNRDIGYLPGNLWEKLKPYIKGFHDAHNLTSFGPKVDFREMFAHPRFASDVGPSRSVSSLMGGYMFPADSEAIELVHSGHLRGRSIHDTMVIVDEAQNFTPGEMKGMLTRLAPGSKMVIIGDPGQVDHAHCRPDMNGLTYAIQHYLSEPYSALFPLPKSHRHQIAAHATNMTDVHL